MELYDSQKFFFSNIQGRTFILEKGFDPSASDCEEVWDLVRFDQWMNLAMVPITPIIIPVVLDFYSNLKFYKKNKLYVRHKKVNMSPKAISEYYGIPYYENDDLFAVNLDKFENVDMDIVLAFCNRGEGEWK